MNTFQTSLLLTSLTLVLVFVGQHYGGRNGMPKEKGRLRFFVPTGRSPQSVSG